MLSMFSSASSPPIQQPPLVASLKSLTPLMVTSGNAKPKARGKKGYAVGKVFDIGGVNRPMPKISVRPQIYRAVLTASQNVLLTSVTVPTYYGLQFSLSSFPGYAEYTGLFDQYKIVDCEMWTEPSLASTATGTNIWYSAVDLDDANTPTSVSTVSLKQSAIASGTDAGHYHHFVPHVAVAEYSGSFTSYGNVPPTWVDSASPGVLHYGLKMAANTDGVARQYYTTTRIVVEFREAGI